MSTLRMREFPRGRRGGVARIAAVVLALASPGAAGAGWEQIAAGTTHSCGIAEGGRVICWGASSAGQTSAPDTLMRQVVSGRDFSCALAAADGAIDCWGDGGSGQTSPPGAVYAQISAGDAFACGLRFDSTLECWGSNADGQLNVPAGRFTRVSAGAAHACARRESGAIDCWGADVVGQASPPGGGFLELTAGRRHSCALNALGVAHCWGLGVGAGAPAAAGFQQISAGDEHTCALRADATLECWGADGADQASPPAGKFRSVHAGSSHTCGIRSDGRAECWGRDDDDQASPPEPVAPDVAAGGAHSCALRADGGLDCWGLDAQGQATPPAGAHVALDAGANHGCAVRSDGGVSCWGDDAEGQVSGAATAPAPFFAVTTGRDHSCALSNVDGLPHCWGSDALGQLQAPALRLESIDAGSFHSCGIGDQGAVHCWGFDGSGQASPPADPMTRVSAGSAHSCGIRAADRTLVCWGLDDDGQSSPPPGPFIAVSAGRLQSCGVRLDGVSQCWGATGPVDPPDLRFVDVSVGASHACGVTTEGIACWGDASLGQLSSVFDDDDDGIESAVDRCPAAADPAQLDTDADRAGDVCDVCPGLYDPDQADSDGDGVGDLCDNCVDTSNPLQLDTVRDGRGGNACRPLMLRLHPAEISTELTRYRLSVRCGSFDVARLRFGVFYPQSVAPSDVDFGDGCDDVEGCSVAQGLGDTVDPFNSTVRGPGLDEIGIRTDVQYVALSGLDNAAGVPALCSGGDFSEVFLADLLVAGVHDFGIPFMLTLQGLDLIGGVFSEGGPIGLPDGTPGDPTAFMMTSGDVDAEVTIEIRPAVGDNTGTLWDVFLFSSLHEVNELRVGYTGVPNQPASSLLVSGCETFTGGAANERSCAQVSGWPAAADASTSSTVGPDPGGSILPRDDTVYAELLGALPSGVLSSDTLNYPGIESLIARVQDLPPLGQLAQPPVLTFDGASSAHGGADAIVVDGSPLPVSSDDVAFINAFTPGTDFDGDLVHNSSDNCPHIANPGQEDGGGFMLSAPDGTGDHCECGESTDNGAIFSDDLAQLRQGLAGDPLTTVPGERCSLVGDPASCDMADVVALARALGAQPGPGVGPSCAAAVAAPSPPQDP